jgi:O-methyltransferase involved in polyketide biosynthesis
MGTVAYLTDEAIFGTLRSIARASAAGSELVLDFASRMEDISPQHRPAVEKLLRYTARRGEPLIGFHEPADFVRRKKGELGFELVEMVPPEDHESRFLAGSRYGFRTLPCSYFAHFRRRATSVWVGRLLTHRPAVQRRPSRTSIAGTMGAQGLVGYPRGAGARRLVSAVMAD